MTLVLLFIGNCESIVSGISKRILGYIMFSRQVKNAYRILVSKLDSAAPLGKPWRRWGSSIKMGVNRNIQGV
jgi:hypothetical protein